MKDDNFLPDAILSVIGNALRVSEPLCKYRHSEGRKKISERDSIITYLPSAEKESGFRIAITGF